MKTDKKNALTVILNIAIIITAVFFIAAFFGMISELKRSYDRDSRNTDSLSIYLEDDDFGGMANVYHTYNIEAQPESTHKNYLVNIAEYADIAFKRKMYAAKGESFRADEYQKRMDGIKAELNEYSIAADKIDDILSSY